LNWYAGFNIMAEIAGKPHFDSSLCSEKLPFVIWKIHHNLFLVHSSDLKLPDITNGLFNISHKLKPVKVCCGLEILCTN